MTCAIILAGGLGTRLRAVVPDLPKPMAAVNGRPFLEHLLDYWIAQGVSRFVLSVGYRHEAIVDYFGDRHRDARLGYAIEHTPLGTGGGMLKAARTLAPREPFFVLNGDTYFAVDAALLESRAAKEDTDWCFSLFRAREPGRYMGMEVASDGRIMSLRSGTGMPGRLANGGVYRVHPRALEVLDASFPQGTPASLEDDIFPLAMSSAQRMTGIEFSGAFIDIGVPDDYHRAASVICLPGEGLS